MSNHGPNVDYADDLYKICCNGGFQNLQLPNPVTWIYNQNKMRNYWETYISTLTHEPLFVQDLMINNNFGNYMNYMYNTYPPGCNTIKNANASSDQHHCAPLPTLWCIANIVSHTSNKT